MMKPETIRAVDAQHVAQNESLKMHGNLYAYVYDKKQTQLGFALKYFPYSALSEASRRMVKHCKLYRETKHVLNCRMNETKTQLRYEGDWYEIVWRNNAIPTETEWNSWQEWDLFDVEFRLTNLHGYVAILHHCSK